MAIVFTRYIEGMTKNYKISGESSEVAVDSLIDEVRMVDGTFDVEIDIAEGRMTVTGENFSDADIEKAAQEAGFSILSPDTP